MQAQASGKFIVSGEYAVLQGAPCLVFPILDRKIYVEAQKDFAPEIRSDVFLKACHAIGLSKSFLDSHQIAISSELPIGSGLGSSAALCVALARLGFPEATDQEIFERALAGENVFHGEASGVDPACSTIGKPLIFEYNPQTQTRKWKEFRSAPHSPFVWLLRNSQEKHQTHELIREVHKHEKQNEREAIFSKLQQLSCAIPKIISEGRWSELPESINLMGENLAELGILSPALEHTLKDLKQEGALAVKLTGAGGGGFAIGLFEKAVAQKIRREDDIVISFSAQEA
jgi:mevalonate kinase